MARAERPALAVEAALAVPAALAEPVALAEPAASTSDGGSDADSGTDASGGNTDASHDLHVTIDVTDSAVDAGPPPSAVTNLTATVLIVGRRRST